MKKPFTIAKVSRFTAPGRSLEVRKDASRRVRKIDLHYPHHPCPKLRELNFQRDTILGGV